MEYRREIDGLRALAVIPVILYHAGFGAFRGGFVGVDIFFVISGFLITTILIAEKTAGTYSIVNFYERRARRILPALYFMMVLSIVAAWFWLLPDYMVGFSRSLIAVPLFISNILFSLKHGYFESGAELKPLLHTWSLAVEEQYYVLFPLFLTLIWQFSKKKIVVLLALIALASLALAQWGIVRFPTQTYFLLPTRAWEILLGALLAFINYPYEKSDHVPSMASQALSLAGLMMILSAVYFFDGKTPIPGIEALIPTLGTILIIQFASEQTLVGWLLGTPLLVGTGLISYSAYLWHQPLFAFVRHINVDEPKPSIYLLVVALSLLFGYLSWRFIETPFRQKGMVSRRSIFQFAIVGALAFFVFGLAGQLTKGFPFRYSNEIQTVLAIPEMHSTMHNDVCNLEGNESELRECIKGDKATQPTFAVIGDSQASALIDELEKSFSEHKMSFFQYTKNGCPFLIGINKIPSENCAVFQHAYLEDLKNKNLNTYIISSRWSVYLSDKNYDNLEGGKESREMEQYSTTDLSFNDPFDLRRAALLQAIKKSLIDILNSGKNLILVYPVPEQGWDVTTRHAKILMLRGHMDNDISISTMHYRERDGDVIRLFDELGERRNLARVKPEKIFCDSFIAERCVATFHGIQFYLDDNHLSNEGAQLVVNQIVEVSKKFSIATISSTIKS
jgi:peptidoglycan/LPS O-acetylase OafA/YrhL